MAVTLADVLKTARDAKQKALVWSLVYESPLMEKFPFATHRALQVSAIRVNTVEDAAFRPVGGSYTESTISPEVVTEGISPMGGAFEIDRLMLEVAEDPATSRAIQLENKFRSIKYKFHDQLVNGDRAVDEMGFDGLKKRVDVLPASQKILAATGGLDVKASTSNQHTFLDKVHELVYAVADHKPDFIITGKDGYLVLSSVARRAALLDVTRDQYDRVVVKFMGVPVVDVGTKGDQSTQIITKTEDPGDGGLDTTSYYAVRLGAEQYLGGIQAHSPKIIFDGVKDDGVTHKVVVEWPVGIALWHKYAVARLFGVIP